MANLQASSSDLFKSRVDKEARRRGMSTSGFVNYCLEKELPKPEINDHKEVLINMISNINLSNDICGEVLKEGCCFLFDKFKDKSFINSNLSFKVSLHTGEGILSLHDSSEEEYHTEVGYSLFLPLDTCSIEELRDIYQFIMLQKLTNQ